MLNQTDISLRFFFVSLLNARSATIYHRVILQEDWCFNQMVNIFSILDRNYVELCRGGKKCFFS
jgi:hypothetical protein